MEINLLAILVATAVQFACGAAWYTSLFGNLWGKIHGHDKYSKAEQQKMMQGMGPFYALQAFVTLLTSSVLALFASALPEGWNLFGMAGFFWIGFVVPTQVSGVIFGGTEPKWIVKKIAVMAGGALVCLMAAALVLRLM